MTPNNVDVQTLRTWLERQDPVTVLDIRKTADRNEWAIPGSLHVDAYDALKADDPNALLAIDLPVDKPVVTVCGAGKVSLVAAEQLRRRGLTAFSLAGGMKSWSLAWNSAPLALPGSAAQVIQVRRTGKGCLSYLIGSNGVAAVIDPALEPDVYLELAQANGWQITHIFDTHIHADHLSRARSLAAASGATLYLPVQQRVAYPFHAISDGDVIAIGAAHLQVLHTPGHTLESVAYRLDDQALFTGDTLFLGGVGRPDLEANATEARKRAHLLYHSLHRLLTLPDATLILPGHTSQPVAFDGVVLAAPLATVRQRVALLQAAEEAFVESLLARLPPTPPNHARIVAWNESDQLFAGDPTEWEAGANRCAIA
jgi:glyoxylase-like metal-dependent hydrolase (beta-lactamase superfamily II)/rhodanese-related sulfurtransferase